MSHPALRRFDRFVPLLPQVSPCRGVLCSEAQKFSPEIRIDVEDVFVGRCFANVAARLVSQAFDDMGRLLYY